MVIIKRQADAITFAEWGIAAIAVGGMSVSDRLLSALQNHRRVFVLLDNTEDGVPRAVTLRDSSVTPHTCPNCQCQRC